MNLNRHLVRLQQTYRAAFNTEFDPRAFRSDVFYASLVLDKSLRTGSRALQALAAPLEQMLLDTLYSGHAANADLFSSKVWPALHRAAARGGASPHRGKPGRAPQAAARPADAAPPGSGRKRFGDREIFLLSRLRLQYRRRFGTFFDIFEFTRNELYARSLLMICAGSGDTTLQSLAGRFINRDTPPLPPLPGHADPAR